MTVQRYNSTTSYIYNNPKCKYNLIAIFFVQSCLMNPLRCVITVRTTFFFPVHVDILILTSKYIHIYVVIYEILSKAAF